LWLAACLLVACSHRTDLTRSSTQENFGVQMARMNLWREAMFRFKRAVEINPGNAVAHNNLAVAYEANGDFENARKEYLEALRLDRSNQYIQKNYSRYVEFLSRNKKRQSKDVKVATTPAVTTTGETPQPAPVQPPPVPPPTPPLP
jgi:Tfp pilus assembly protein PilF